MSRLNLSEFSDGETLLDEPLACRSDDLDEDIIGTSYSSGVRVEGELRLLGRGLVLLVEGDGRLELRLVRLDEDAGLKREGTFGLYASTPERTRGLVAADRLVRDRPGFKGDGEVLTGGLTYSIVNSDTTLITK